MAESVMHQLPLWGRLMVNGVIFFGLFGVIGVVMLVYGFSTRNDNDGSDQ